MGKSPLEFFSEVGGMQILKDLLITSFLSSRDEFRLEEF